MSEYPYLEKAVKHYKDRFKKRPPIRDEAAEYNELKMALHKSKAFDEIRDMYLSQHGHRDAAANWDVTDAVEQEVKRMEKEGSL